MTVREVRILRRSRRVPFTRQLILLLGLGVFGGATPALAADGPVLPAGIVRFQVGSADLTPESKQILDRIAAVLKRRPEVDLVKTVGHADDQGTEGVNVALSLGRAQRVKLALAERGIAPSRIEAVGMGSQQPISIEQTENARALNRRVEVWLLEQKPIAAVTRVIRDVKARAATAPAWEAARTGQTLERLARVRTEQRSSSEITFREKDRVALGPEALVIIYDAPSATRRSRRDVSDIQVEDGTIFASLAERERTMEVGTKSGQLRVRSKRMRVDVRPGEAAATPKKVSTVSVFDGESDVSAQGKTVNVPTGYGTRVKEGLQPEPARLLPPSPGWSTLGPIVIVGDTPSTLGWTAPAGVPQIEVQLGAADDPEVLRPNRIWSVRGNRTELKSEPGVHHLRLAGVDERGISGAPGTPRVLVAFSAPSLPARARPEGGILLDPPGTLTLPAPNAMSIALPTAATRDDRGFEAVAGSTRAISLRMVRPGKHVVPLVLTGANQQKVRVELRVRVGTATLTAEVGQPSVQDGMVRTTVRFSALAHGRPVPELSFKAGVVPAATERLLATAKGARFSKALVDCHCASPADARPVRAESDGSYSFVVELPARAWREQVILRIFEVNGRLAVELPVSVAVSPNSETP